MVLQPWVSVLQIVGSAVHKDAQEMWMAQRKWEAKNFIFEQILHYQPTAKVRVHTYVLIVKFFNAFEVKNKKKTLSW